MHTDTDVLVTQCALWNVYFVSPSLSFFAILFLLLLYSVQPQHFEDSDTFSACRLIWVFHNPVNSNMDYRIFNVHYTYHYTLPFCTGTYT